MASYAANSVKVLTAGGASKLKRKQPTTIEKINAENFADLELEAEDNDSRSFAFAQTNPDRSHSAEHTVPDDPSKYIQQQPQKYRDDVTTSNADTSDNMYGDLPSSKKTSNVVWLGICFFGIMCSFVLYGLLLEYTTSGGRKLHELSFLFVTSGLYTLTAAAGRYVRDETPSTIPPARFAVLALTSMGSTFCSVRSLRYVIFPIQVLAKSCKPVPVMLMGALMGKTYPLQKYMNVVMIVLGVALFTGGGNSKKHSNDDQMSASSQLVGVLLLFISLCFDGGTGAYEDKLMSVFSVEPFDLMYNIQLGKTILAGIGLVVLNQVHEFYAMVQQMGFLLIALGLSGAMGQVFIFVTIARFGALTCSIIGLARKVTTLLASIYFYGHSLNGTQSFGLLLSVAAMLMNFWGKKKAKEHVPDSQPTDAMFKEETEKMLDHYDDGEYEEEAAGNLELAATTGPALK